MKYDVTGKNLAKKIKKDGTISKVNDIAKTYKEGNIIVTFFGVFIAVLAYQIVHTSKSGKQYKQWIVQLKSEDGTIYEMKHTQAHSNKNMPKTAKIIQPSQPKIKIPEIKYQLCLPPARTAIDFIIQNELHPLILKFNNDIKLKQYRSKPIPSKYYKDKYYNLNNDFQSKFDYLDICLIKLACVSKTKLNTECRNIVKKCMIEYHPDRTHKDTNEEFTLLADLFNRISA